MKGEHVRRTVTADYEIGNVVVRSIKHQLEHPLYMTWSTTSVTFEVYRTGLLRRPKLLHKQKYSTYSIHATNTINTLIHFLRDIANPRK